MRSILFWLTNRLPCRIISDNDAPYLERYYLATLFGVRFYLHRFVGSDPSDRGLHDHPWPWACAVVLCGWYFEDTRQGMRKVRWLNWIVGDKFHRVIMPAEIIEGGASSAWTLFFHRAAYTKPWGFWSHTPGSYSFSNTWVPYNYPKSGQGTNDAWWLTSPYGHESTKRQPK
jgi:hypothetical protein